MCSAWSGLAGVHETLTLVSLCCFRDTLLGADATGKLQVKSIVHHESLPCTIRLDESLDGFLLDTVHV